MRAEWRVVSLDSVCTRMTVGHVGPMVDEYIPEGVPFLRSQNIKPFRIDLEGVKFISEAFNRRLKKSALRPGDLAVIRTGYPGTAAVVPDSLTEANCADLVVITPGPTADPFFLAALFNSTWGLSAVGGRLVGSAQQHFNVAAARSLEVRLPPLRTQHKIVAVLSAYDDLIENNNRRIKLLEEMAQRLYREWFVSFRYPGHDGVQLVDSELGPIPQGWSVVPLKALCRKIVDGDWVETKDQGGDAYRLLQVSNVGLGVFRETGNYRYVSGETFDRLRCTEVQQGFVLVARMPDPIGRAWFVDHLGERAITAVDIAILEPDVSVATGRFVAFSLNSDRNLALASARASGTTRARITRRDLETFPFILPTAPILRQCERFLDSTGAAQLSMTLQNLNLSATRDLLLPRLISGEIDVDDLDIVLEAA